MKWTARNTVNLVGACLSLAAGLYAYLGGPLPASLDAVHLQALALGLLVGLLTPGSPVGRVIDQLVPPDGAKAEPIDAATISEAAASLQPPRPTRVPPSREGSTALDPIILIMLAATAWAAWNAMRIPLAAAMGW